MLHLQGVEPGIFRVVAGRLGEALEEQLLGEVKISSLVFLVRSITLSNILDVMRPGPKLIIPFWQPCWDLP